MRRFLLASALLFAAGRADAAILAACSEDVTCTIVGTVTPDTTAGHFNSGFARVGLLVTGTTGSIPQGNRVVSNTFPSASSNFWISAYYNASNTTTTSGGEWLGVLDAGVQRILLRGSTTSQILNIQKRNAAGTTTNLGSTFTTCGAGVLCRLDIHIVYGISGSIDIYNNGGLAYSYTGDITTDGATSLNQVELGHFHGINSTTWSELIVADTDTRSMRMITCAPLAAGNTQSWTGTAGNINANAYNDTVFNYTTANNALSQWTTGCTVPSSGTTSVVDVRSYARLAKGASGPQNARFSLRVGGGDYNNGSNLAGLTTSFQNFSYDWGGNSPATGAPWLPSEFGSGFNLGVLSQP